MLAYFVVYHKNGFSPNDLRKSQKNGGKLELTSICPCRSLTRISILGYFKKDSPDFINYKGQSINGPQQVEAFAQAQSIGTYDQHGWAIPMTTIVYSIPVYLLDPVLQRKWQFFGISFASPNRFA
jgi:hypothetical protein